MDDKFKPIETMENLKYATIFQSMLRDLRNDIGAESWGKEVETFFDVFANHFAPSLFWDEPLDPKYEASFSRVRFRVVKPFKEIDLTPSLYKHLRKALCEVSGMQINDVDRSLPKLWRHEKTQRFLKALAAMVDLILYHQSLQNEAEAILRREEKKDQDQEEDDSEPNTQFSRIQA